jgi:DegV family protein with EDD domain
MTVKIVTDSCADLTREQARELDITIVPLHVRFGDIVYRDGVDISVDEFYSRLGGPVHPNTAAPAPGEFARAYEKLFKETNEIVSIHVTRKHSAVLESATIGKDIVTKKDRKIEVIDSRGVTMWQGLLAMAAAEAASKGYNLNQVVEKVNRMINQIQGLGVLDSLKYAIRGGRLSNTLARVESILSVKTLVTCRDGQIKPAGIVRSWNQGIDRLVNFVKNIPQVEKLAVVYNTNPDDAQKLINRFSTILPNILPKLARLGPTVGVHGGPGTLITVVQSASTLKA